MQGQISMNLDGTFGGMMQGQDFMQSTFIYTEPAQSTPWQPKGCLPRQGMGVSTAKARAMANEALAIEACQVKHTWP